MDQVIYHIVAASDWQRFAESDFYEAESLKTEGFIHLSTHSQVSATLNRYFVGVSGLLLLYIDATILGDALLYEASTNAELFPHLYSQMPKGAVIKVQTLVSEADGTWVWSKETQN